MAVESTSPMDLLDRLFTDDNVATLLLKLPRMTKSLPYVGVVMGAIDSFFPDEKHEAVIKWLEKLSQQLEKENRELVNLIKMEALNLRYGKDILIIQAAFKSLANIANARDDAERQGCIQRFREFCSDQKHTLAINSLIDGLRGKGILQINILDHYCTYTGGYLPKVRSLAKELLQVVYGGFMAMCMYETLMRGNSFAETVLNGYNDLMEEAKENIESVFERCKSEHRDNMLNDMNEILDSNVSNSDAVNSLSSLMSEKYDWLVNYCIVCDEPFQMDCSFKGNYVSSFERNSKFGVVFYQDITEIASDPARQKEVNSAIYSLDTLTWSTKKMCEELIDTLRGRGIETYGCAVIRQRVALILIPLFGPLFHPAYRSKLATLRHKGSSSTAVCYGTNTVFGDTFYLVLWK